MKQLLAILLFGLLCVQCTDRSKEETKNRRVTKTEEKIIYKKDGLQIDTIKIHADTIQQIFQVTKKSSTNYLLNFLVNPLDLKEFKKNYGPSNSGNISGKGLFKPDSTGIYLQFMLFNGIKNNQISNIKLSESQLFEKFQIYVYRYGKEIGDFFDSNEVLIGFKCSFENKALKRANLVGKSKNEINELFGNDFMDLDSIQIYQNNNRVLSLCFESSTVKWMKYYKLSSTVSEDSIPERLLKFYDN